ncbi:unnamed protein product [Amoebophrya sp. A25]|nr:unnamed protein product [Amoebophrya sp. A25]|eukprot:GSA25T00018407001.1
MFQAPPGSAAAAKPKSSGSSSAGAGGGKTNKNDHEEAETEKTRKFWTSSCSSSSSGASGVSVVSPGVFDGFSLEQSIFLHRLADLGLLLKKVVYDTSSPTTRADASSAPSAGPGVVHSPPQNTTSSAPSKSSLDILARTQLLHTMRNNPGDIQTHFLSSKNTAATNPGTCTSRTSAQHHSNSSMISSRSRCGSATSTSGGVRCVIFYPTALAAALFDDLIGLAVTRGEFGHGAVLERLSPRLLPEDAFALEGELGLGDSSSTKNTRATTTASSVGITSMSSFTSSAASSSNKKEVFFRGVLVESNFRVRACTNDPVQIDLLRTFTEIQRQSGYWVVGELTQDSLLRAFSRQKLTAKQILHFLACSAHESRAAKCRLTGQPLVPDNVRIQIELWERDRQRLKLTPTVRLEWSHAAVNAGGRTYMTLVNQLAPDEILDRDDWANYDASTKTGKLPCLFIKEEAFDRVEKILRRRDK